MPKILIQYEKTGALTYLSHLELMRALERSFRRAQIELERSGGFHPRPKISYGPALPVGASGHSEYLVADIKDPMPKEQLIEQLNRVLPEGLRVCRAKYIPKKHPSIMSAVQSAAYRAKVAVGTTASGLETLIRQMRNEERLSVIHKGSQKWVDTNQSILEWYVEEATDSTATLYMLLAAGEKGGVRPEALIDALSEKYPQLGGVDLVELERLEQYVNRDFPLIDVYNFYESVKMGSEHTKS